jgi:hypothetical protein
MRQARGILFALVAAAVTPGAYAQQNPIVRFRPPSPSASALAPSPLCGVLRAL